MAFVFPSARIGLVVVGGLFSTKKQIGDDVAAAPSVSVAANVPQTCWPFAALTTLLACITTLVPALCCNGCDCQLPLALVENDQLETPSESVAVACQVAAAVRIASCVTAAPASVGAAFAGGASTKKTRAAPLPLFAALSLQATFHVCQPKESVRVTEALPVTLSVALLTPSIRRLQAKIVSRSSLACHMKVVVPFVLFALFAGD
jgi:hypothetical protein